MAKVIRLNTLSSENEKGISVPDAYDLFLRSRKISCSEKTCQIYKDLGRRAIIPGLADQSIITMEQLDAGVLRELLNKYAETHTPGGVNFLFHHLKAFVNWYQEEYDVPRSNPIDKVHLKSSYTPPKAGITREEVDLLLQTAKDTSAFPERDIAMLMILCDTGIRFSSLFGLKIGDVCVKRGELTVFEKDQRYHVKSCGASCTKSIKRYLDCLAEIKPSDPFWLKFDGTSLTEEGMRQILRRLCRDAGIELHLFHDFRRFYGLELYKQTRDIYFVSRALDHKDIEVTKRYLAIDEMEDAEAMRIVSPMDLKARQTGAVVTSDSRRKKK